MVGEGRRDLRKHTKPGALKKSHAAGKKKKSCALSLLMLAGAGAGMVWLGWVLGGMLSRVVN